MSGTKAMSMSSLTELAMTYGTAKHGQGFMPIYEYYFAPFKNEPITLVEIGVHEGASLRMWRDWFPKGGIIGIEKHIVAEAPQGCRVIEGDASERSTWKDIPAVDIVVDDGSHFVIEQLKAFDIGFPRLSSGGWWVVEDLFALYDHKWNGQDPYTILDRMHDQAGAMMRGEGLISEYHIHVTGRSTDGILFIRKR
jgi:hypothetical protein